MSSKLSSYKKGIQNLMEKYSDDFENITQNEFEKYWAEMEAKLR